MTAPEKSDASREPGKNSGEAKSSPNAPETSDPKDKGTNSGEQEMPEQKEQDTDSADTVSDDDLTIEEQGSMTGVMGGCYPPDDRGVRIGVIKAADEVVDRSATGIDEQQQGSAVGWVHADPVLPVLNRSIKVRERAGVQLKRLQLSSGEI